VSVLAVDSPHVVFWRKTTVLTVVKPLETAADRRVVNTVGTGWTQVRMFAVCMPFVLMLLLLPSAGAAPAQEAPESKAPASKQDAPTPSKAPAAKSIEDEKLDPGMFSERTPTTPATEREEGSGAIMRMILGLVVVLGAIYGVHWFLRRYGQKRGTIAPGATDAIEVVATTPLAPNRTLHLVRVGSEMVLIGATDHAISTIGTVDAHQLATEPAGGSPEFQLALQGALAGTSNTNAGSATRPNQQTFLQRFVQNLQMMTAR
jgi:flagellar biosynthetic protein FliO